MKQNLHRLKTGNKAVIFIPFCYSVSISNISINLNKSIMNAVR